MSYLCRRAITVASRSILARKASTYRPDQGSFLTPQRALTASVGVVSLGLGYKLFSGSRLTAEVVSESSKFDDLPVHVTSLRNRADSSGRIEDPGRVATAPSVAKKVQTKPEPQTKTEPKANPEQVSLEKASRETSDDIEYAPYLLIGAGTASFAAFRAIKSRDPMAKILIIGEEDRAPYMRPPLSKELWYPPAKTVDEKIKTMREEVIVDDGKDLRFRQWNGRERSLYYESEQFYTPLDQLKAKKNGGISVMKGTRVERIDAQNQAVYLSNGKKIYYGKCLIATGGKPKNLEVFHDNPEVEGKVTLFRSVKDFYKLHDTTRKIQDIVVIGGGFLGSELACALGARKDAYDLNVTQIYHEEGNMAKVLPQYLSQWTTDKVKAEGVNILNHTLVDSAKLDRSSGKLVLTLNDGKEIKTDHAVVAVGIQPDHQLALDSSLEIDDKLGGFRVNAELEARTNLWVAGDAACFYDTLLGRRRVEHHDHAVVSGRLAGGNMAGDTKPYSHQSMFWSDLGPDVGYEAIGLVDSKLPTVGVFAKATAKDSPRGVVTQTNESLRSESEANIQLKDKPVLYDADVPKPQAPVKDDYGKGVVFYLKNDVVVGVLLWNVFNKINIARRVLRENKRYDDLSEVAKLFDIHDLES